VRLIVRKSLNPAWRIRRLKRDTLERSLQKRGWYDRSARSDAAAVFIGGCGRSGTTLFKQILNRHSRLACGPETSMFGLPFNPENIGPYWDLDVEAVRERAERCRTLVEFAEGFYAEFLRVEGKARWADKTPNNVRARPRLLTWFPRGRFIHVIRDGRDVACSLRHHPRERVERGRIVPVQRNNPIPRCAERWLADTSAGLAFRGHPRCLEVRYEDLVGNAEAVLRRVCEFIGEPFESAMLEPAGSGRVRTGQTLNNRNADERISASSIGRWRRDLTIEERAQFRDVAGELLLALGYAPDHAWMSEPLEQRA
jgi:protein-tyrosine sulfotransferase